MLSRLIAEQALAAALKTGGDFAEIFCEDTRSSSLTLNAGAIETALTAAETGHLVFATLHTNSAADAIDRMVNVFPDGQQAQIRLQLSTTLRAVLSQQLLPKRASAGRIAACEIMVVTDAIRNLIREGKTPQIESFITLSGRNGSITMDQALRQLVQQGAVAFDTAVAYARDREAFQSARSF